MILGLYLAPKASPPHILNPLIMFLLFETLYCLRYRKRTKDMRYAANHLAHRVDDRDKPTLSIDMISMPYSLLHVALFFHELNMLERLSYTQALVSRRQ